MTMCSFLSVYSFIVALLFTGHGEAFLVDRPRSRGNVWSSLSMISLGNSGSEFPRDVKDAVTKCRSSVQEALQKRLSRMDIEMPVGTRFGVEKSPKTNSRKPGEDSAAPTMQQLQTSDRELARLFVEMFQPVGGDHISVVFNDQSLADLAKSKWKGDPTATCRILTTRRSMKGSKSTSKPRGFAAKMKLEVGESDKASGGPFKLPEGTEVALFVSPGPKELVLVEKVCKEVGMGTLVILINARLSKFERFASESARDLFLREFEPVFHLRAAPQENAPGCLLYRAYPGGWLLARRPKVGKPKVILTQAECPTATQCKAAFENMELTDVERGVEKMLDSVSGWFR